MTDIQQKIFKKNERNFEKKNDIICPWILKYTAESMSNSAVQDIYT